VTEPPPVPPETLVRCLPPAIRARSRRRGAPEHRPVTIAFIRFEGIDALIEERGSMAAADALHCVVTAIEARSTSRTCRFSLPTSTRTAAS
jgi:hypothetical protein